MTDKKDIKHFEDTTENVLSNTLAAMAEGLTGLATSSKNELILSVSHTFQKMRGGQFLSAFLEEWNKYREKGRVEESYQHSEQHKVCLQELLEFLDKDSPDELRFTILKQIFLVAASEKASNRESFLPQQFMKIARSLSDGEIILLTAIWNIAKNHEGEYQQHYSAAEWIREITESSGMKHRALVEIHEQGLMEKRLISQRSHADRSGVAANPHNRLTDLGYELCMFIDQYEE